MITNKVKTKLQSSFIYGVALAGLLTSVSCSNEEKVKGEGVGHLQFGLATNPNYDILTKTTMTDPNAPSKEDFTVNITGAGYDESFAYSDDLSVELEEGYYTVKAVAGNPEAEGYVGDDLETSWYEALETILIVADETENADLRATLKNALVGVEYTEKFKVYFDDYTWDVTLQAGNGDIFRYEMGEEYETLYLNPGTLKVNIEVSDESGIVSQAEQNIPIEAAKYYNIKFDTDEEVNIEGKAIFTVTFEIPESDPIEINLAACPVLTLSDAFDEGIIEINQGVKPEKKAFVSIAGKGTITSAILTVGENVNVDLLNAESVSAANLSYISNGTSLAMLDFTNLLPTLSTGNYTYQLSVSNDAGQSQEIELTIRVQ